MESVAEQLIVVVQAVQRNVGLVTSGSRHGTSTAVRGLIDVPPDISDARLQAENPHRVAAFRGKVTELRSIEHVALTCVSRVHQRRLAFHLDDLGCALDLHGDVQRCRLAHLQGDLILLERGEPRHGYRQRVGCWWDLEKLIHSVVTRFGGS